MINKNFKTVDYRILKTMESKMKIREKFLRVIGNDKLCAEEQAATLTEGYRALNQIVTSKRSHEVQLIRDKFAGKHTRLCGISSKLLSLFQLKF